MMIMIILIMIIMKIIILIMIMTRRAIFCGCYISVLTNLLLVHPPKRSTTMIYQICHFQMPVSTRIIYVPQTV